MIIYIAGPGGALFSSDQEEKAYGPEFIELKTRVTGQDSGLSLWDINCSWRCLIKFRMGNFWNCVF